MSELKRAGLERDLLAGALFVFMNLPGELWELNNPHRRMMWAVLLLARHEALEGGDRAGPARRYLASQEATNLFDLLGVERGAFLTACEIEIEEPMEERGE